MPWDLIFELKEGEDSVLVYFFKNERLERKLSQVKIKDFLNSHGYESCLTTGDYLNLLRERFTETCPDEIGIFLGYPLKDVIDFKHRDKKHVSALATGSALTMKNLL